MSVDQNYVQILVEALQNKERILKELLEITKNQEYIATREAFSEEDFSKTLDSKDGLIQRLNQIDNGFEAAYQKVRAVVIQNKTEYRNELLELQNLIKRFTDLGVELEVLERRNKDKIESAFSLKRQSYKQVKTSQSVANNYYKTMAKTHNVGSYFVDKKK